MNGEVQTIGTVTLNSLTDSWNRIVGYIPEIISAVIVVAIGILVATLIAKLVRKILQMTKIDQAGNELGIHQYLKRREINFSFSRSIAWLVKWAVLLAFVVAAIDILGVPQVSNFVRSIIAYIPNVIIAIVILSVGFIAARYIGNLVENSARISNSLRNYASQLGTLASGALVAFALMAALIQLGIAANLITILFAGLVGMLALAGGLAFGLGGRKSARQALERFQLQTAGSDDLYLTADTQETIKETVPNCLLGLDFPAKKAEVVKYCNDRKAKHLLRNLDDKNYFSLADVIRGLRGALS